MELTVWGWMGCDRGFRAHVAVVIASQLLHPLPPAAHTELSPYLIRLSHHFAQHFPIFIVAVHSFRVHRQFKSCTPSRSLP